MFGLKRLDSVLPRNDFAVKNCVYSASLSVLADEGLTSNDGDSLVTGSREW
jgi:hypothetical protein